MSAYTQRQNKFNKPPDSHTSLPVVAPAAPETTRKSFFKLPSFSWTGILPVFLMLAASGAVAPVAQYAGLDFDSDFTRGGVIAYSALYVIGFVLFHSPCVTFNAAYGLHAGVEAIVIKEAIDYANETDDDVRAVLSMTIAMVILVHLLPFAFLDMPKFLKLLAAVGVVANTTAMVLISPALLLLAAVSSAFFLIVSLDILKGESTVHIFGVLVDGLKKHSICYGALSDIPA